MYFKLFYIKHNIDEIFFFFFFNFEDNQDCFKQLYSLIHTCEAEAEADASTV